MTRSTMYVCVSVPAHAEVHKVDDTVKPAEAPTKPASSSYESFLQVGGCTGTGIMYHVYVLHRRSVIIGVDLGGCDILCCYNSLF